MGERIRLTVNGQPIEVAAGATVAVAVIQAGVHGFRRSVTGQWRAPLCGMGICFECRVTVDSEAHVKSCQTRCRDGMEVVTG